LYFCKVNYTYLNDLYIFSRVLKFFCKIERIFDKIQMNFSTFAMKKIFKALLIKSNQGHLKKLLSSSKTNFSKPEFTLVNKWFEK